MKEQTILLGRFSKAYAMTDWRIGYVAANSKFIEAMTKIHQYTMLCAPIMIQMAAIEALKNGESEIERMAHLANIEEAITRMGKFVKEELSSLHRTPHFCKIQP